VTPGVHPLILTTDAGTDDSDGRFTVGDATPVLYSISPSVFVAGQTYTNVTILGIHLGTNCTTPTFSGAGSTYFTTDCTQSGDTRIVGTVAVPSNAPATNSASVSVNVSGYDGLAFAPQQVGQSSSANLNNITIQFCCGPIQAQVFVTGQPGQPGQQQFLQGQAVYITADPSSGNPAMPQLAAQLVSSGGALSGNVQWTMSVFNQRPSTKGPTPQPDTAYYPSPGGQTVPATSQFIPTYGNGGSLTQSSIQGGIATLTWNYLGNPQSSGQFSFPILGQNPKPSQIYNYFEQAPVNGMWFFIQLIAQESGWLQFYPGVSACPTVDKKGVQINFIGYPCFGPGNGFGVMQLDNSPSATSADLWNWQQNVIDGQFQAESKYAIGYKVWKSQEALFNAWNAIAATYDLPTAPPPNDFSTGSCDFTFQLGDQLTYSNSTFAPHSFGDAFWMTAYNGGTFMSFQIKAKTGPAWTSPNFTYVFNVCEKPINPPTP
jgi:hypothetical protein